MVILYNFLPNLRSPESVGEIRKSVGAIRRVRREAEISRRFGAPQMAGRARRRDRSAARTATNGFQNLRSPEPVGAIRKSGRAHSASALAQNFTPNLTQCISQRARSPAHRSHRSDKVFGSVTSVQTSVRSVKKDFLQKVRLMPANAAFGPPFKHTCAACGRSSCATPPTARSGSRAI